MIDAKDYNEARKVLGMGLKKFPKSYALWVAMGTLYDSMGDCFEALKCFDTALLFAPKDNSVALFNKALILMDLSCHRDALAIMQDLAQSYPDDPKYAAEKGRFFLEMGYLEEAMVTYLEAIDVWQRSQSIETGVCIYTGLCSTYVELGMKTEALKIAHEGLEKFPDQDPYLYQNMGAVFYEMGWRSEAIEILEKGIKKFPGDEDLKEFLKDLEDETDDPSDGETPPLLGLILLMLLLYKKSIRRK